MKKEEKKIRFDVIWSMIKPIAGPRMKLVPFLVFGALLLSVMGLAEPYIFGTIVDLLVGAVEGSLGAKEGIAQILPLLLAWGVLVLIETGFTALHNYGTWYNGNYFLGDWVRNVYGHMLTLDLRRFQDEKAGEMLRRFDNTWEAIWRLNSDSFRQLLPAMFTFVLATIVGFFIDWRMALVALVPVPIMIGVGYWNLRLSTKQQDEVFKYWEHVSGYVGDSFANIATVKSFTGEGRMLKKVMSQYLKSMNIQMGVNKLWAVADAGYGGVYIFGRLLIFVAGSWFVLQGSMSIGVLIMFLGFSQRLFSAVQQIVGSLPEYAKTLSRLNRAALIWAEVPKIQNRSDAKDVKRVRGEISIENLKFGYLDERNVLKNVSFTIPEGETWALVGESGAGKSTLAKMMLRFEDPKSGSIKIDGRDLRDFTLASLRSKVGFVMQENLLFHEKIIDNIRFAKPGASKAQVIDAAKRAQAHDFISKLKEGYGTMVGERGVKLSGGEKQRIALARVLLENPPILVLDEATSALDSKTEHALQTALAEVMKDRTTIVIAHRLSTVMAADNILVMDKGKIVDQGTHKELVKRGGLYKNYWEIQAGGYV